MILTSYDFLDCSMTHQKGLNETQGAHWQSFNLIAQVSHFSNHNMKLTEGRININLVNVLTPVGLYSLSSEMECTRWNLYRLFCNAALVILLETERSWFERAAHADHKCFELRPCPASWPTTSESYSLNEVLQYKMLTSRRVLLGWT